MTTGLQDGDLIIVAGRPSMGKAQPLDAKVKTPHRAGRRWARSQVGDALASIDGAAVDRHGRLSRKACARSIASPFRWSEHGVLRGAPVARVLPGLAEPRVLRTDKVMEMLTQRSLSPSPVDRRGHRRFRARRAAAGRSLAAGRPDWRRQPHRADLDVHDGRRRDARARGRVRRRRTQGAHTPGRYDWRISAAQRESHAERRSGAQPDRGRACASLSCGASPATRSSSRACTAMPIAPRGSPCSRACSIPTAGPRSGARYASAPPAIGWRRTSTELVRSLGGWCTHARQAHDLHVPGREARRPHRLCPQHPPSRSAVAVPPRAQARPPARALAAARQARVHVDRADAQDGHAVHLGLAPVAALRHRRLRRHPQHRRSR